MDIREIEFEFDFCLSSLGTKLYFFAFLHSKYFEFFEVTGKNCLRS